MIASGADTGLGRYLNNEEDLRMALESAKLVSDYHGIATRVEEILIFSQRMGYKKIGVAACYSLLGECNQFARAAAAYGVPIVGISCKVGAIDKTAIGAPEEEKLTPNVHESMCNPIMQAEYLNGEGTDLNVVIGLCVGHDTLFIKYSKAPVTYLIVKDRVLCHNPAGALYTSSTFYSRLFKPEKLKPGRP
jgi:uncharacterized metal-binding protein